MNAANRKNIINADGMNIERTRLIFDSIMIRLIPFYDYLCSAFGGEYIIDKALIPCVDMLLYRVEGLRGKYLAYKSHWLHRSDNVMDWATFKSLESEILRLINYELYKEGIDAEYEEGELTLWALHNLA
jgi:hypothetical protein